MNGGWVQIAGPLERVSQFKQIETTFFAPPEPFPSLQQWRWPPSQIANTPAESAARLVTFPGSQYVEPQFSWKWATLPVALVFIEGKTLGPQFEGDLLVNMVGRPGGPGYLLRFHVIAGQSRLGFDDPNLLDRVADNNSKYDLTESESLIAGEGYGIATDMQMSPRGTVYVVSYSNGAVYEIFSNKDDEDEDEDEDGNGNGGTGFSAQLTGAQEAPGPGDPDGRGTAQLTINSGQERICFELIVSNIDTANAAHIHRGVPGQAGPVVVPLSPPPANGSSQGCVSVDRELVKDIRKNPSNYYVNVHNRQYPNGAIRGVLVKH
ncbi:MAG TPA: CHRD domain-containing protein [Bryobacteraceae bacterium]|nr:CHRD domain-containing protein [Bryobacteraceae bacterium]